MKLSHRDFRPPRRSKYVGRPPRRRPTLRILLLGLFGLAVYLKFDAVARLPFWQTLRHPGAWLAARLHPPSQAPAPSPVALAWEPDSSGVKAECPASDSLCLGPGFPLGAEAAGEIRAILSKAAAQWQVHPQGGFAAAFARERPLAAETRWALRSLELRGPNPLRLAAGADHPAGAFCANGRCLDEIHPRVPLSAFASARIEALPGEGTDPGLSLPPVPAAGFSAAKASGVWPILRGRVVAAPGDSAGWLKLHHGGNLFSYYRGLARLGGTVRAGAFVETGDTLGWIADSGTLELRIESGGTAVDPLAFLGLAFDAEGSHVR